MQKPGRLKPQAVGSVAERPMEQTLPGKHPGTVTHKGGRDRGPRERFTSVGKDGLGDSGCRLSMWRQIKPLGTSCHMQNELQTEDGKENLQNH